MRGWELGDALAGAVGRVEECENEAWKESNELLEHAAEDAYGMLLVKHASLIEAWMHSLSNSGIEMREMLAVMVRQGEQAFELARLRTHLSTAQVILLALILWRVW